MIGDLMSFLRRYHLPRSGCFSSIANRIGCPQEESPRGRGGVRWSRIFQTKAKTRAPLTVTPSVRSEERDSEADRADESLRSSIFLGHLDLKPFPPFSITPPDGEGLGEAWREALSEANRHPRLEDFDSKLNFSGFSSMPNRSPIASVKAEHADTDTESASNEVNGPAREPSPSRITRDRVFSLSNHVFRHSAIETFAFNMEKAFEAFAADTVAGDAGNNIPVDAENTAPADTTNNVATVAEYAFPADANNTLPAETENTFPANTNKTNLHEPAQELQVNPERFPPGHPSYISTDDANRRLVNRPGRAHAYLPEPRLGGSFEIKSYTLGTRLYLVEKEVTESPPNEEARSDRPTAESDATANGNIDKAYTPLPSERFPNTEDPSQSMPDVRRRIRERLNAMSSSETLGQSADDQDESGVSEREDATQPDESTGSSRAQNGGINKPARYH